MSAIRPIRVMVSSRNSTQLVDGRDMTALRRELEPALAGVLARPSGDARVQVWINESSEAPSADAGWYDKSVEQARLADVVLVLFSGDAGSIAKNRTIGVCHAELQGALDDAPTKVRVIDVRGLVAPGQQAKGKVHEQFVALLDSLQLMTSRPDTADAAVDAAVDAVGAAIHELALGGIGAARRGRRSLGAALDWRRLTFAERKAAMEHALAEGLVAADGDRRGSAVLLPLDGETVLFVCHAAPEGLGLASSRELVGQPQRNDHRHVDLLADAIGPVHVLACPAGVTANQVRTLLGASELVVAETSSGIWAADAVERGQVLALRDCSDVTSLQLQLQSGLEWLRQSGEDRELLARARRRRAIVRAMVDDDSDR